MKQTAIAITMMTLILIAATAAQPARRVVGSTTLGGGSGGGVKNRQPRQIGNPLGLGGTVTAGVKNRRAANLGDTATHEVSQKRRNAQFRPNPAGDGTTEHFRKGANPQTSQYNPKEIGIDKAQNQNQPGGNGFVSPSTDPHGVIKGRKATAAKYDGIDGESNDARTKNPNQRRQTQNLLPYIEQDNIYKAKPRKR